MTSFSKISRSCLAAALAISLASPLAAQVSGPTIAGSAWTPVDIAGTDVDASVDVFIRFDQDGTAVGNGGCNSFTGPYVTNGDAILFGPFAATMMLCQDPASATEAQFFEGLGAARTFTREGAALTLADSGGSEIMRLTERDAD